MQIRNKQHIYFVAVGLTYLPKVKQIFFSDHIRYKELKITLVYLSFKNVNPIYLL